MRLLPTSMVKPGMRLGKAITAEDGKVLLGYNVTLTGNLIDKLKKMGYFQLYIEDARTSDIIIEDALRDDTRVALRNSLLRLFSQLSSPGAANNFNELKAFSKAAGQCMSLVMDDLDAKRTTLNDTIMVTRALRTSTSQIEHFFQNALNVCVYAVKLGIILGLTRDEQYTLGLGALFHDIGNTQIPLPLLQKNTALTSAEFQKIQKHTEYGFTILKNSPGIPLVAAHCALLHHEKTDGSGYPFGLPGNKVHPFAKWVGLLDAYDAMTNPRPYRAAIPPDQALEILFAGAGTLYDKDKVELFRDKVAIYPLGQDVALSTGQSGIVSKINSSVKHRPTVRVLRNENGEELGIPYEIDLSQHLHIMIQRVGVDMLVP
ncbi:HD-GYP domain-containing protein [Paenibacillus hamazuiensis]|uniref:HD-GYP domain-containing protein n=1 Tax=Paenibacillus hamazuiensis TaxID=2936508 RepID=UPI00200C62B0|nr:HD-GYP domain-containing protein [Paenibacillus hamazuiensis]